MDWIVLEGVQPWDGRYQFDLDGFELTTREWGWIKRLTGYMPLTVGDGFEGGDPELFAAFAVIALHRAGKVERAEVSEMFDRIADAPAGSTVRLESDSLAEQETDAGPPAGSRSGNGASSGPGSPTRSESWEAPQSGSGMPASDSSESLWARSET